MSLHSIDRLFKNKLGQYKAPVKKDLWNSIETQLDQKPAGSTNYRSWLLTGAVLLVSVLLLSQGMDSTLSLKAIFGKEKVKSDVPVSVQSPQPEEIVSQALLGTDDEENDATVASETESNTALQIPGDHANQHSSIGIQPGTSNENNNGNLQLAKGLSAKPGSAKGSSGVVQQQGGTSIAEDNKLSHLSNINARSSFSILNPLTPLFNLDGKYADLSEAALGNLPTDCYKFGKSVRGNFFADLYFGPVYSMQSLSSRDIEVAEYIDRRRATESARMSFDAGLRFGYMTPRGYSLMTGLHYTQVNQIFDYFNPDEQRIETIITIDTIITPDTIFVSMDTSQVVITGKRIKKTQNRYYTLDIPLLFGYEFVHGNWNLAVNGGPVLNLLFQQKGDIVAVNGDPVNIDSDNPTAYNAYKSSLGLSFYASVQASKRIGNTLYFFAEPHVLYRFKSITVDSYPVDERQHNVGLSVGLRMKL